MENTFTDEYIAYGKTHRLNREVIITEKLDGTCATIEIWNKAAIADLIKDTQVPYLEAQHQGIEYLVGVGSKEVWLSSERDNRGFFRFVQQNLGELVALGEGRHSGEWWGSGIGRGYGLTKGEKRFSLFNTSRWSDPANRPSCCECVPVLYEGPFLDADIRSIMHNLRQTGSLASPGFDRPEGIVIFHSQSRAMYKYTFEHDERGKPA
jgi:RNA ligase